MVRLRSLLRTSDMMMPQDRSHLDLLDLPSAHSGNRRLGHVCRKLNIMALD